MGDMLDATDAIEQTILDHRINAIRSAARTHHPVGKCHWCEEPFSHGSQKIFCDSDCSEDYEKYHRK